MRLLLAFSFYSNVSELFASGGSKRVGQIGPLHFMRFLSVSWIIAAYTLKINFSLSGKSLYCPSFNCIALQAIPLI